VSTSRAITRYALSKTIELRGFQREAARLVSEISRLKDRITQVTQLEASYREHLNMPNLSVMEYRSVIDIFKRLGERKSIDEARLELLVNEQIHIAKLLVQKKQHIEKLEDEAQKLKRQDDILRQNKAEQMMPARRPAHGT
jgi:chromosome segregation ATPase